MTQLPGMVKYHVGDVVEMRKTHPCGSTEWQITRTGIDFVLKCVRCGRRVMLPRLRFEKQVRRVVRHAVDPGGLGQTRR